MDADVVNTTELEQALAPCDETVELRPRDSDSYKNRGAAYHRAGVYDRAIADYDKAIQLNPTYARAHLNRGAALNTQGKKTEAIADLKKVLELSQDQALRQQAQQALDTLGVK